MLPNYYEDLPELCKSKIIKTIYVAVSKTGEKYLIDASNDNDALNQFDDFANKFPDKGLSMLNKYETTIQGFCILS